MSSVLKIRFQVLAGLAIISSIVVFSTMYYLRMTDEELVEPTQNLSNQFKREIFSKPKIGASQFIFIEASCSGNEPESAKKVVRLNSDQACAIESAAKSDPSTSVYLYHLCPLDDDSFSASSPMVNQLFERYDNLFLWHESLESLLHNSQIEEFFKSSNMSASTFHIIHISDMLRYFLLWKYGGTYLDLDFIVVKPLDSLAADFIALESEDQSNDAAIRLRVEGTGHEFAEKCLEKFRTAFTGSSRQETGPALVTNVLREVCNTRQLKPTVNDCRGLAIYPPEVFYPLPYWDWRNFYNATHGVEETLGRVAQSYAIHLWGSMMFLDGVGKEYKELDRVGTDHPKAVLSRKYCPIAYQNKPT